MSPKSVFLVEDNQDDVELTLLAFKKTAMLNEIIVARDGQEALDYLFGAGAYAGRDVNAQPALILLDYKMPKLNGDEVLARLRADERAKLIPVVMLTSSRDEEDRRRCYTNGANSFVCKPVDFTQFVEAMRQLGSYWLGLNEPPPVCSKARP